MNTLCHTPPAKRRWCKPTAPAVGGRGLLPTGGCDLSQADRRALASYRAGFLHPYAACDADCGPVCSSKDITAEEAAFLGLPADPSSRTADSAA